jgi:hypothetical protein
VGALVAQGEEGGEALLPHGGLEVRAKRKKGFFPSIPTQTDFQERLSGQHFWKASLAARPGGEAWGGVLARQGVGQLLLVEEAL